MALVADGRRQVDMVTYSQIELHEPFGGVVPEVAARAHLERLPALIDTLFERSGTGPGDVARVAVTRGPGLIGCLLVGTGLAAGLADAWAAPLVGVNHLWGHVYAAFLSDAALEPPLLALVVSGAHSDLVWMPRHAEFEVLGRTRDDAAGEAFDKAARMLGLPYPGGPALDRLARQGDASRQRLPVPSLPGLEYSFSGLKTALLYRLRDLGDSITDEQRADLAAAFERSVVESLLEKLDAALDAHPTEHVVICGGVAANTLLRARAADVIAGRARLTIPPLALCTDNAAMIAAAGYFSPERTPTAADPGLAW